MDFSRWLFLCIHIVKIILSRWSGPIEQHYAVVLPFHVLILVIKQKA